MKLHFFGATRQVTGSCYMLEAGALKILIDCGMYQERDFVSRNWDPFPFSPDSIDAMIVTHAHLDHVGLIPKLVKEGFDGDIFLTPPSRELAKIVLEDAAHIQEEDAAYKRKRHQREGRKSRRPVVPLYLPADAAEAIALFRPVPCDQAFKINKAVSATFRHAGHILGSASVEIRVQEGVDTRTLVLSGDLGQWDKPLVHDPALFDYADYVVMESTYGGRCHNDSGDIEDQLAEVINATVSAGGNVLIPTFAVERAQELMYHIGELVRQDRIVHLMCFLDSPMAVNVTEVFRQYRGELDEAAQAVIDSGNRLFSFPGMQLVRHVHESKAINRISGSCIIMAGSGMCTGGRIKHHLVTNISRPNSTVLFVGYQANGTLGRRIVDRQPTVRIHGKEHEVKARIAQIYGLSAHADNDDLIRWLAAMNSSPKRVFLTHGEEDSALALKSSIQDQLDLEVEIPNYKSSFDLE